MIFKKKIPTEDPKNTMPPLDTEEEDTPDRGGGGAKWVTLLCVILAIALLVSSLPSGISSSTSVNAKIYSDTMQQNTISTVLSGGGTLTPQEGEALSIPQALEVKARYVSNGDHVKAGDPIAQVDKAAVLSAISELQEVLDKLDSDIASNAGKTNSSSVRAGSSGRIKKIYAQVDTPVSDTMYENGALMLLSLDGLMAVDLDASLPVGQAVTVTLSDGTALEGTVDSLTETGSTVTLSDETAPMDDIVTVTDANGGFLGQGQLYIHSMLRVTGAYGTVSTLSVKENQKIYSGATLLTLKDTGHTAQYAKLLSRRSELEAQMESLVKLSKDGILYADTDGLVSNLDGTVDLAVFEAPQRSHASPGYKVLSGTRMEEDSTPAAPGEEGGTGGNAGGEDGSGSEGGTDAPSTPETPPAEGQEYTLGYVLSTDGGIFYIPQGTMLVAEGSALPSLTFSGNPNSGIPLSADGLAVKCSTGTGWEDADAGQITAGDSILIGNGLLVFQHNAAQPSTGELPGGMGSLGDLSGLAGMTDMSGMSGMSGMGSMGGMSGSAAQSQAVYDSYDTTTQDVATIVPEEEMTVEIQVDELDILSLQVGMSAQVTMDALPGKVYTGTITKINAYGINAGGNTKYTVTVTLPREENMLSGMNASVKITTAVSQPVQTVPAEAVFFDSGKSWLYTGYDEKTDTLLSPVAVETGMSDGSVVEILSGLDSSTTFYYRYADTIEYSFVG